MDTVRPMTTKPVTIYAFPDGTDVLDLVQKMNSAGTAAVRQLWRRSVIDRAVELLDSYAAHPELVGTDIQGGSVMTRAARHVNAELGTLYVGTLNNRSSGLSLQVTFSREAFTFETLAAVDVYSDEMRDVVATIPGAVSRGVHDGDPVNRQSRGGCLTWSFDAASATDGELERLLSDEVSLAALAAEYGAPERRLATEELLRAMYEKIFSTLDGPSRWRALTIDDFPSIGVDDLLRADASVTQ